MKCVESLSRIRRREKGRDKKKKRKASALSYSYNSKTGKLKRIFSPHKKGIVVSVKTKNPRKPNSAIRKVATVRLSNSKQITVYLPGENNSTKQSSTILVQGRGAKDISVTYESVKNWGKNS